MTVGATTNYPMTNVGGLTPAWLQNPPQNLSAQTPVSFSTAGQAAITPKESGSGLSLLQVGGIAAGALLAVATHKTFALKSAITAASKRPQEFSFAGNFLRQCNPLNWRGSGEAMKTLIKDQKNGLTRVGKSPNLVRNADGDIFHVTGNKVVKANGEVDKAATKLLKPNEAPKAEAPVPKAEDPPIPIAPLEETPFPVVADYIPAVNEERVNQFLFDKAVAKQRRELAEIKREIAKIKGAPVAPKAEAPVVSAVVTQEALKQQLKKEIVTAPSDVQPQIQALLVKLHNGQTVTPQQVEKLLQKSATKQATLGAKAAPVEQIVAHDIDSLTRDESLRAIDLHRQLGGKTLYRGNGIDLARLADESPAFIAKTILGPPTKNFTDESVFLLQKLNLSPEKLKQVLDTKIQGTNLGTYMENRLKSMKELNPKDLDHRSLDMFGALKEQAYSQFRDDSPFGKLLS